MLTHKRFFLHIILKYFVCTALLPHNNRTIRYLYESHHRGSCANFFNPKFASFANFPYLYTRN